MQISMISTLALVFLFWSQQELEAKSLRSLSSDDYHLPNGTFVTSISICWTPVISPIEYLGAECQHTIDVVGCLILGQYEPKAYADLGLTPPPYLAEYFNESCTGTIARRSLSGDNERHPWMNYQSGYHTQYEVTKQMSQSYSKKDSDDDEHDDDDDVNLVSAVTQKLRDLLVKYDTKGHQLAAKNITNNPACKDLLQKTICTANVAAFLPSNKSYPASEECSPGFCQLNSDVAAINFTAGDWKGSLPGEVFCDGLFFKVTARERIAGKTGGKFGPRGNQVMVFNTTNPTPGYESLGTANQKCNPSEAGLGKGAGGAPGKRYVNCFTFGYGLIISKDGNSAKPVPNPNGGIMRFKLPGLFWFHGIYVLDNRISGGYMKVYTKNGTSSSFPLDAVPANGMQFVNAGGIRDAVAFDVVLTGPAAIVNLVAFSQDNPICIYQMFGPILPF